MTILPTYGQLINSENSEAQKQKYCQINNRKNPTKDKYRNSSHTHTHTRQFLLNMKRYSTLLKMRKEMKIKNNTKNGIATMKTVQCLSKNENRIAM